MGDQIIALKDKTHRMVAISIPVSIFEVLGGLPTDDEIARFATPFP